MKILVLVIFTAFFICCVSTEHSPKHKDDAKAKTLKSPKAGKTPKSSKVPKLSKFEGR